jgi:glycosyltransferase involved in cell wall biosynthesis
VINDGSTDNSAIVAKEYLRTTDGIDYKIITQPNAGVAAARNNGVAEASGEYIVFLDADDWWEPTYLERMAQLIKDYPEAGLYACNYVYYKPGKTHVALDIPTGYINYPEAYYESGVMPVTSITAIMPRAVFDEMGGYRNHLWMAEDFDLWIRIVLKYKVVFLNEPLAYYNQEVQLKWRALGKLYPPLRQFAFDADYLIPYQENDRDIKHVVDMVKIVCLKQYYISLKYHQLAVKELEKIDLNEYRNQSFASYIWQPLWKLRILTKLCDIYKILKNK